MSRGDTFNNFLRVHDQCIYDWLNGLKIDYGKPRWPVQSVAQKAIYDQWIAAHTVTSQYVTVDGQEYLEVEYPAKGILRVYGSPQKAFSTMAHILIRKGWSPPAIPMDAIEDTTQARKVVPLPFCSIVRNPPEIDFSRENPAFTYRHIEINEQGQKVFHPHPAMYKIQYQLDFWCQKKYTEAHIYEWIQKEIAKSKGLPRNEIGMTVKHGGIWGDKFQVMKFLGWADNSDLEPDVGARRELRFTATFELNATMFHEPETTPVDVVKVTNRNYQNSANEDTETGEGIQDLETRGEVGNLLFKGKSTVPADGKIESKEEKGDITRKLTFGSASSILMPFDILKLTATEALVQIASFQYFQKKDETASIKVEIVNGSDTVLVGADILKHFQEAKTRAWNFAYLPVLTEEALSLKFTADGPTEVMLKKLDIETHKVLKADFVNFTGPIVVGGKNRYVADGLTDPRLYLVSGDLLDTGSSYGIITANAETDPTATSEEIVNGANRTKITTVITPKFGQQKLTVDVDDVSATLSNLVAVPF